GLFVNVQGLSTEFETGNAPSLTFVDPHLIQRANEGVAAQEGDHVTVMGYVSGLSGTSFTIGGTRVDASSFSLSGITNAVLLQVEGTFSGGVLVASKITRL
ncbi:MAG TPA: hypothetical protein VEM32_12005, partial [Geobacteraceae bacterium]|nr:hypothetical protein [Geobacteraceae bacterium]